MLKVVGNSLSVVNVIKNFCDLKVVFRTGSDEIDW